MKKREFNKKILYGLIGIALGIASIVHASNTEQITHKVKANENLWSICEKYYDEENSDMEFIDFFHQVERENFWLKSVGYRLKPNDEIKIPCKKKNSRDKANTAGNLQMID